MRLGTFFYVCVTGVIVLLPSWFWEELVFSPWLLLRHPHWKRMDVYYVSKRREGTRFYEIFCKLVGHLFLLPGTSVKPIEQLRPYHSELLDEEELAATAGSGRNRIGKEFYEASIVAVDHTGTWD